jgi:hypothetical protein
MRGVLGRPVSPSQSSALNNVKLSIYQMFECTSGHTRATPRTRRDRRLAVNEPDMASPRPCVRTALKTTLVVLGRVLTVLLLSCFIYTRGSKVTIKATSMYLTGKIRTARCEVGGYGS